MAPEDYPGADMPGSHIGEELYVLQVDGMAYLHEDVSDDTVPVPLSVIAHTV